MPEAQETSNNTHSTPKGTIVSTHTPTQKEEEIPDLELRSDEVQEILSYIPHWIIRWGITIVFFTFMVLLAVSWFMKYPDIIQSSIMVTTKTPPQRILARSSGALKLMVKDGQNVKPQEVLGYIQNPTVFEDYQVLKKQITRFQKILNNRQRSTQDLLAFDKVISQQNLKLGELQGAYESFAKTFRELLLFYELSKPENQIQNLQSQIVQYKKLNQNLLSQQRILGKEFKIFNNQYKADSTLAEEKLMARLEFDKTKASLLQQRRALKNGEASIINNRIRINELQNNIGELTLTFREQERTYLLATNNAFQTLRSQVNIWLQRYMLTTPVEGKVSFLSYWSDNQFVKPEQTVMAVIPQNKNLIGKINMPVNGSGKVKVGQVVNIRFANYPADEFGMVEGKIERISLIAQASADPQKGSMYTINVSLPNGLKTSYKKDLEFKAEMQGQADIITKDLRLIERIFNQFAKLFDKF
ncbi:HlyD family efflux transporter periplasmic adaptor subunit [uncultured Microscilla sp.]|uniref:HlyD family efflux transporter periplasmic adaptor subunit n=1 Tax=uncultured Microscilla sp. TaxID=432653 RepID=UPI00260534FD|nr:HlyD family efflux transporter periplasmic adaptor subunit [uncultured Microscilla sp.]